VEVLRDELALDRARRVISDMYDDVEDALAGGATLEQIANETDLELGLIEWVDGMTEGIAGYTDFRDAAEVVATGDFPETIVLEDGGIAALRLEEIQPPAPRPLDEVVVQVIEGWEAAATQEALMAQAEGMMAEMAQGAAFDSLGYPLQEVDPVARDGFVEGVPASVLSGIFEMETGERRAIAAEGAVHLVQLDRITGAGAESTGLRDAISSDLEQAIAQDVFQLFAGAVQREAGISLNEAAINAVHAQFR
jgi:peptidyl-prolyl cis-trans isomerase D